MSRLLEHVDYGLDRAGSLADLADALGVSEVQVGRIKRGTSGMSVASSLALAEVNDTPDPARVVEDAGHKATAQRLRRLYGTPGRNKLTPAQQELHQDINDIDPTDWQHLRATIRRLAENARELRKKRSTPRPKVPGGPRPQGT